MRGIPRMKNRRLVSPALSDQLELIGDGLSFTKAMRVAFGSAVLFENFTPADIHSISTYMHAYRANMGATIFGAGEPNGYLCVLAEGLVGVYKKDESGKLNKIGTIQPGEIFGKTSLFQDLPYTVSLIAEAKSTVLLMSRENFRLCADRNPALGMRILLQIAQRLSLRLKQTSEALVKSAE